MTLSPKAIHTHMTKPKCEYAADERRCHIQSRHFICNTSLYRHCDNYQRLFKQDKFREQSQKTIESLAEDKAK
jgi:hypothetical protein